MDRYDDLVEASLTRIREIAAQRIAIERDDDDLEFFGPKLDSLEEKFGREVRLLTALFFDDPDETEEQRRRSYDAWFEYERKRRFRKNPKSWAPADVVATGPPANLRESEERSRAVKARVDKLNAY